jgi:RHH-type proline utilization regulon transcriptional repressor/proline dehydrogenase/delta 1-pyrroline-5-carboxylate dehydrogenase
VVACLGPDAADVAAQSAAARAAGNKVVLTLDETCDAVLVAKADSALRQRVAARPGAIVSVIEADSAGAYPVWRLLKEQSISVNTAAAGGNAALLALGDEG